MFDFSWYRAWGDMRSPNWVLFFRIGGNHHPNVDTTIVISDVPILTLNAAVNEPPQKWNAETHQVAETGFRSPSKTLWRRFSNGMNAQTGHSLNLPTNIRIRVCVWIFLGHYQCRTHDNIVTPAVLLWNWLFGYAQIGWFMMIHDFLIAFFHGW
jgi:hypothetical protein